MDKNMGGGAMRSALLGSVLCVFGTMAMAQEPEVTLNLGFASAPYHLDRAFRTIQIGDPKVVDVKALNDHEITFQPLQAGSTNVLFLDESGKVIQNLPVDVTTAPSRSIVIMKPAAGALGMSSLVYRCSNKLPCRYLGADIPLDVPAPVQRTEERRVIEYRSGQPPTQ